MKTMIKQRISRLAAIAIATIITFGLAPQAQAETQACTNCITFSAEEPFGIFLQHGVRSSGGINMTDAPNMNLEWSTNQVDWSEYKQQSADDFVTFDGYHAGLDERDGLYKLYIRGTNNTQFASKPNSGRNSNKFTNTLHSVARKIACTGNAETLLDWKTVAKGEHPKMDNYALCYTFWNMSTLTTAPDLPATNLTAGCYAYMFQGCRSLTNAPAVLPAVTLTNQCYQNMFKECTSLTKAPKIAAMNQAQNACNGMFLTASALKVPPKLLATNIVKNCYQSMFQKTAIELKTTGPGKPWMIPTEAAASAANAAKWCYNMFSNTTSEASLLMNIEAGKQYYIASATPVTLTVPAVEGASKVTVVDDGDEVSGSSPYTVYENDDVSVTYTADNGYMFPGGETEFTTNFTATADPMVLTPPTPISKYTCQRTELKDGESINLVAGTYTAAPTTEQGGVFKVGEGATLTGTNVTFAGNSTSRSMGGAIMNKGVVTLTHATFKDNVAPCGDGGAINNNISGVLNLNDVTFENNTAGEVGGAISNWETANLLGPVSLVTANDTLFNLGLLNWNLTGETTGVLNGYQNLINENEYGTGTLQITVDDYAAPTNFVIATGDFSNIAGKDTFTVTNTTTGGSVEVMIGGGFILVGDKYYSLTVVGNELQFASVKAAKLSNVDIVDMTTEPPTTNATAMVYVGDTQVTANPDGSYTVPEGTPIKITYTVTENALFGSCLKEKDLWLNDGITGDYSMTDADKEPVRAALTPAWADEREIALDTRERIVVSAPTNVLPIAYSTNFWATTEDWASCNMVTVAVTNPAGTRANIVQTGENGYAEWFPEEGAYGKYTLTHSTSGTVSHDVGAEIYYSTYFPLTITQPAEGGTITATTNGAAATGTFDVLGYEYVNLTATPIFNGEERYDFKGWSATTNDIDFTDGFTNTATLVTRFTMPNSEATIKGAFTWKTKFTDKVTVNAGETWNVYEDDDYPQGITNNGTVVWKPGATNKVGKAFYLAKFGQLQNGDGKLQIVFDSTLTNGTYTLAKEAYAAVGVVFEITNGSSAKDCTVVDSENEPTADWVYVGAKRFKLSTDSDGTGTLTLLVESGIPMAINFTSPIEGGSFTVSTGVSQIATGTKVYPSEKVVLAFAPANDQWQAATNTLQLVDATNKVYGASYFSDVTLKGANFKMTETNATFSMAFMISDGYRAELLKAAEANYASSTNAIEQLRENRLTDGETDYVLKNALGAFTTATNDLAAANKPAQGDSATNTLAAALTECETSAKARSDNKPWTITVDANATADGTNVFNTIDAAFAATDFMPYATNLVVIGEQEATTAMPAMRFAWNLIVTNWQAKATYDNTKSPYKQTRLVLGAAVQTDNLTNMLAKVTGEGRILVDDLSLNPFDFKGALNGKIPFGEDLEALVAMRDFVMGTVEVLESEYVAIKSFKSSEDVVICGKATLSAPDTILEAKSMIWELLGNNQTAHLVNYSDIVSNQCTSLMILLDNAQTDGNVVTNYVIAGRANTADGAIFRVCLSDNTSSTTLCYVTVGGETKYIGPKAYKAFLVADETDSTQSNLVFDVAWGKFAITYEAMAGKFTNGTETNVVDAYVNKGYEFPTEPKRDNYTFNGWFRNWSNDAEKVTALNISASPVLPLAKHSLYAHWTPVSTDPTDKDIAIPDIKGGEPVLSIGEFAYAQRSHSSQKFESLVTPLYLQTIGKCAFQGVTTLKTLIITPSRSYDDPHIAVPLTIGQQAFASCTGLEEIRIPDTVSKLGIASFMNCAKLKRIIFTGVNTIECDTKALFRCGYDNGAGELKVYMKKEFCDNNVALTNLLATWNTTLKVVPLVGKSPASGESLQIEQTDFGSLGADRKVALLVKVPTLIPGTMPDVSSVIVKHSTNLSNWSNITPEYSEASEDGTVLIEFTMPEGNSGFMKVEIAE